MPAPAIRYTIAMPAPQTHLFHVTIEVDQVQAGTVDLIMPAWTPGSYMIREYARHVQAFAAEDRAGRPLAWRKTAKDCWQIDTGGAAGIRATYQVYAHELTVRTSHLDPSHGYFNGATVFMFVAGRTGEPVALEVIAPPDWLVTTGLAPATGTTFHARDYDELIDCPVECGPHRLLSFLVDGKLHRMALWGRGNEDAARLVADTRRIVEVTRDIFGGLPYRDYTFILHLAIGRGGLEHRNSVTNLVDRWTFHPERSYERFLSLQAHEFFHVWNVKRIRAASLGPFDYRAENYTRLLWAMEGVTSYYDDLLLRRAGLITDTRLREIIADDILTLHAHPGRRLHSLEESSFDAWIKLYRQDEHFRNSSVSYYLKGSLVALLLDLEIRGRTAGERSLDDVLRLLYQRYPVDGPGIPEEGGYMAAVAEVAGGDWTEFYQRAIAGTDELDYDHALAAVGLRLQWSWREPGPAGSAPAWLGMRIEGHRIAYVSSNGPAMQAGVAAGDELVAWSGWRASDSFVAARLAECRPGDQVVLSVFRRDELLHIPVTLGAAPYDRLALVAVDVPTPEQRQQYQRWAGADLA